MTSRLLNVEPSELRFTYELNEQATSILQLSNNSKYRVAFKVMARDAKKYDVKPTIGVINSLSACEVKVIMLAPRDFPPDMMQCKDIFLIKSVIVSPWITTEDARQLFKEPRHTVEDYKVNVVYTYPSAASNHQRLPAIQVEGENGVDYHYLIMKIFNFVSLVVQFLIRKVLPVIWSLTLTIVMLVVRILENVISVSVEEWIRNIAGYVFVQYIQGNLRNIGKFLKLVH